jgi:hypothetical protein
MRDGRRIPENGKMLVGYDFALLIAWHPQSGYHAPHEMFANGDPERLADAGDFLPHPQSPGIAEHDDQDIALIISHDDAFDIVPEVNQLTVQAGGKPFDPADNLLDVPDLTLFLDFELKQRNR